MEEKILVNLNADHIFECETSILGREGEGNTSRFEITIPEKLRSCSVYLDFKKPNGEKLRTPKLEIKDGVARYNVVPYLLTDEGEIQVQAVLKTASGGTWKTSIKKYFNHDSINAEDYIEDYLEKKDFISEAQKVLDELSQEVNEIAIALSNNTSFIDNIINRVEEINIEEVDTLQGDVNTLQGDVNALQGNVESIQGDVEELIGTTTDLMANAEAHETKQDKLQEEVERNSYIFNSNIIKCVAHLTLSKGIATVDKDFFDKIKDKVLGVVYNSYNWYTGIMLTISSTDRFHASLERHALELQNPYVIDNAVVRFKKRTTDDDDDTANGGLWFFDLGSIQKTRDIYTFTLRNGAETITYQYEYGMDWEEWIYSEYNDGRIYLYNESICYRTLADELRTGDIIVVQGTNEEDLVNPQTADMKIGVSPNSYVVVPTEHSGVEITFAIQGEKVIQYKALKGMTWAEFVESSYNDGRVYIGKYQPFPDKYTTDDRVLYISRLEYEKDGTYSLFNPAADNHTEYPNTRIVDGATYISSTG